ELRALLVREGGERPGERLAPLPPHSAEQTRTFGSERDPCASSIVGIGLPPNPAAVDALLHETRRTRLIHTDRLRQSTDAERVGCREQRLDHADECRRPVAEAPV